MGATCDALEALSGFSPALHRVGQIGDDVCVAKVDSDERWRSDEFIFLDSMPRTGTGKLSKVALRESFQDGA